MTETRPRGRRLAIVTNIPTPYRLPLFDELARQLADAGDELLVIFAAAGYARRQWQVDLEGRDFRFEILGNRPWSPGGGESAIFSYRGLSSLLRREKPDAVVVGGFNLATTWLNFADRVPYLIWSGSISNPQRPVSAFRRWHRRRLVAGAAGCIAYGSRARDYLVELGARPDEVEIAINTVDVAYFVAATDRYREALEPVKPHRLLYVGNLTQGKRLDRVLVALSELRTRRPEVVLTLVGDGPSRQDLETQAQELGVANNVRFEGFRKQEEIPAYLAASDAFLFPSEYDVWGLVLVEAMAAGVPCLSSIQAGATVDLIADAETGLAVDFSDTGTVADRIGWLLDNPEEARQIGTRARRFIRENASLEVSARGLAGALRAVAPGEVV